MEGLSDFWQPFALYGKAYFVEKKECALFLGTLHYIAYHILKKKSTNFFERALQ